MNLHFFTYRNNTTGTKHYELTNHLGNVLAVISDHKTAVDATTDNLSYRAVQAFYMKESLKVRRLSFITTHKLSASQKTCGNGVLDLQLGKITKLSFSLDDYSNAVQVKDYLQSEKNRIEKELNVVK